MSGFIAYRNIFQEVYMELINEIQNDFIFPKMFVLSASKSLNLQDVFYEKHPKAFAMIKFANF